MVVGVLTHYALLHCVSDLKASQMNVQRILICKLMLYEFKMGYNVVKATRNICDARDKGSVDHSKIIRWLKKFWMGCKNLSDQTRSGRPNTVDSEAVIQAIQTNLVSRTLTVSDELCISQSSEVCYLSNLSKSIQSCWIVLLVTKILQNFDSFSQIHTQFNSMTD